MGIRIEHRAGIKATSDAIWDLISDLPGWSRWNPIYPEAAGTIGLGQSLMLQETIPGRAPRRISPQVVDWAPREQLVWKLTATPLLASSLRYFEIEELTPGACVFANGEIFTGVLGEQEARRNRRALKAAFEALSEAVRAEVEPRG